MIKYIHPERLLSGNVLCGDDGSMIAEVTGTTTDPVTGTVWAHCRDALDVEFPPGTTAPIRHADYSTASENGMPFIANRWAYTGPQGYRVVFDDEHGDPDGKSWRVLSYAGASSRPTYGGLMTAMDAHAMAERLAAPRR